MRYLFASAVAILLSSTALGQEAFAPIHIDQKQYQNLLNDIDKLPTKIGAPMLRLLEALELGAMKAAQATTPDPKPSDEPKP